MSDNKPEERRPSIDERLEAITKRLMLLANRIPEQDTRFEMLHVQIMKRDRDWERFRRALRRGLETYRRESDAGQQQ